MVRLTITLLLLSICSAGSALAERRVAFVLGNSAYDHAPFLPNPVNDAALIGDTLEDLSFEVTRHTDLTVREIGQALSTFLRETSGADVTLFYFAGHGMQFEGKNYLLGRDSRFQSKLEVRTSALELDVVVAELEASSRAALIFVDACRNNPIADAFYRGLPGETRSLNTRGLAAMGNAFEGTMITFSASPGQEALDGFEGGNSPFAKALARHLPTANKEVLSLMKRVIRDVRDQTEGFQTPMVTNDLAAEVYLKTAAIVPQETPSSLAAKALGVARALSDPQERKIALDAVVRDYPGTVSAELAAILLKPAPPAPAPGSDPGPAPAIEKRAQAGLPAPAQDPEAAEAALGLTRADFRDLQTQLREAGHDAGPSDGVFGARSRLALRAYQRGKGEPDHGFVTHRVLAMLEQDRAAVFAPWNGQWELTWYRRHFNGTSGGYSGSGAIVAKADLRFEDGEVTLLNFYDLTKAASRFTPNISASLSPSGRFQISATINYVPFKSRTRVVFFSLDLPPGLEPGQPVSAVGSRLDGSSRVEATLYRKTSGGDNE